ncbi:alginate lyase family protein [Methylobacterium sp. Leaf456]|uniref:alginate lyase family protein n=1 Tax=Methylobacterium sp. Leaf456 TaxID=1736382 RepID=UPI000A4DE3F5|nr:alginate lyase family protein [Methylobacterium sp. Leaf456]
MNTRQRAAFRRPRPAVASLATLALIAALASGEAAAQAPNPGDGACPVPPETPALLNAKPLGKKNGERDEEGRAFNREMMGGMVAFIKSLERMSDAAINGDAAAGTCFGTNLDRWVRNNPATLPQSGQANFEQTWTLSAVALAVVKAQAAGVKITPEVKNWLRTMSDGVRAFHTAKPFTNNHAAWAAVAVGAAAYITGDQDAWRWALGRESIVTDQIQDDGTLPRELQRGKSATSYHLFTAMPLAALNLMQRCRGGVEASQGAGMKRLVALLPQLEQNPQFLAARAGAEQGVPKHYPVVRILRGESQETFFEQKLGGETANLPKALARCK